MRSTSFILASLAACLGSVEAQPLRRNTELYVAECRWDDECIAVLHQVAKTTRSGQRKIKGVASKLACRGSVIDASTEYSFEVLDTDGTSIEPIATFTTNEEGNVAGGRWAKYFSLFSDYDAYYGTDIGRQLALIPTDTTLASHYCTITGGEEFDMDVKRALDREFRSLYRLMLQDGGRRFLDEDLEFLVDEDGDYDDDFSDDEDGDM